MFIRNTFIYLAYFHLAQSIINPVYQNQRKICPQCIIYLIKKKKKHKEKFVFKHIINVFCLSYETHSFYM